MRRAGLLLTPEEADPPTELRAIRAFTDGASAVSGFVDAVVNPQVNAIACAVSCTHVRVSPRAQLRRQRAVALAVTAGPWALTDRHKLFFLTDALALSHLHFEVWTSPDAHPSWLATCLPGGRGDQPALRQAS